MLPPWLPPPELFPNPFSFDLGCAEIGILPLTALLPVVLGAEEPALLGGCPDMLCMTFYILECHVYLCAWNRKFLADEGFNLEDQMQCR